MSERSNQTDWEFEQGSPEAYEQYFVPAIFSPWAERLIDRAGIKEGDHVLDIACGTGIVARLVAPVVGDSGAVVGIDNDEGMLEVAMKTAAEDQLAIEWHEADATDLPFPEERFDVVLCQQGLPFFGDPVSALAEMHRVVESAGRVVLTVGRPLEFQPGWEVLAEALARHIGEEWGAMMQGPFPSWDGDSLQRFARDAGFETVSVTIEIGSVRFPSFEAFVARQAATSPLGEPIGAVEQAVRDDLIRDVAGELEGYADDAGVVFPFESFVIEAEK